MSYHSQLATRKKPRGLRGAYVVQRSNVLGQGKFGRMERLAMAADVVESFVQERWPVMVCILEIALVICASVALLWTYERFGTRCTWDAARMEATIGTGTVDFVSDAEVWSACNGALHPGWLLVFRALGFVYFLAILIYDLDIHGVFTYRFYTQWTFTLTVIYFGLAMFVSGKGLLCNKRRYREHVPQTVSLLNKTVAEEAGVSQSTLDSSQTISEEINAGCLGYLLQILFQVSAPAVLLTDGVYWLVLLPLVIPSGFHSSFLNINVHAINALFMFVEFMLNSMQFPWFRGGYFTLWGVVYTLFLWVMHVVGFRWWPYPFLDVRTPSAPIWYFGLIVLHFVVFGLCLLLGLAKEQLHRLCSGRYVRKTKTITKSFSLY